MSVPAIAVLLVSSSLAQPGGPGYYEGQWRYYEGRQVRFYGHGPIKKEELESQQQAFKQWWGDELVVKLADLPAEGKVPEFRVPYAGHDYPDRAGGTIATLRKYDQAFHGGRPLSANFEWQDIIDHRNSGGEEIIRGPFGRIRTIRTGGGAPWYGHCNGWTAAAIRHAEPQKSVVRNGVIFTPADIKGLLAELYMYTETEFLGGVDPAINPGALHLALANWLGRGSHPVGMETAVGEVVINFPVFAYKSALRTLTARETEVRTTITYTLNINRELDKSPANYHRQLYFHYVLDLDEDGTIRGGRYYSDSGQIDMLWAPLKPSQGGSDRNKRGNPHLDVNTVLAIWRESVSEDVRKQWLNIDPTDEDRILPPSEAIAATEEKPAEGNEQRAGTAASAAAAAPSSAAASSSSAASASAAADASASADTGPPAGSADEPATAASAPPPARPATGDN